MFKDVLNKINPLTAIRREIDKRKILSAIRRGKTEKLKQLLKKTKLTANSWKPYETTLLFHDTVFCSSNFNQAELLYQTGLISGEQIAYQTERFMPALKMAQLAWCLKHGFNAAVKSGKAKQPAAMRLVQQLLTARQNMQNKKQPESVEICTLSAPLTVKVSKQTPKILKQIRHEREL